ncbi:hypothetical protein LRY29_01045 [Candidatus Saccharibacteria bacterium]|nr:hypothetical protein [Candidatus Saccharibacteria bacterium]
MALYLKQNESRSQLQEKLAKELQDRAKQKSQLQDRPDGVTDVAYMKDTKQTTSLAWVWVLIGLAIIALIIFLIVASL